LFRQRILDRLAEEAESTAELYGIAEERQPSDWAEIPCPHRETPGSTDEEWMHELRRNQHQLERERRIGLSNGKWRLVGVRE